MIPPTQAPKAGPPRKLDARRRGSGGRFLLLALIVVAVTFFFVFMTPITLRDPRGALFANILVCLIGLALFVPLLVSLLRRGSRRSRGSDENPSGPL